MHRKGELIKNSLFQLKKDTQREYVVHYCTVVRVRPQALKAQMYHLMCFTTF